MVTVAPSASRSIAPATFTTPLLGSMVISWPGLLLGVYVFPSRRSSDLEANAVIPTTVPTAAFSLTALAAPLLSTGVIAWEHVWTLATHWNRCPDTAP